MLTKHNKFSRPTRKIILRQLPPSSSFPNLTVSSLLFLGRASEKLGKVNDAEKAYRAATRVKPDDVTAWTGLSILYEAQGSARVKDYVDTSLEIAKIYMTLYDAHVEHVDGAETC